MSGNEVTGIGSSRANGLGESYGGFRCKSTKGIVSDLLDQCSSMLHRPSPGISSSCRTSCLGNSFSHPFACPICEFAFSDPVSLACGHSYCKNCLLRFNPSFCRLCKSKICLDINESMRCNVLMCTLVKKWWSEELNVTKLREQAREMYLAGNLSAATGLYTKATKRVRHDHISMSNKSMLLLKGDQALLALHEADRAIVMQSFWPKAHMRRAAALFRLGRVQESLVSTMTCAVLEMTATGPVSSLLDDIENKLCQLIAARQRRTAGDEEDHGTPSTPDTTNGLDAKRSEVIERVGSACLEHITQLKGRVGTQYTRSVDGELLNVDDLECLLCCRLLFQPISTSCGHTFCRPCLDRWLDHKPACPLCNSSLHYMVTNRERHYNQFLQHAIETLLPEALNERTRAHNQELLPSGGSEAVGGSSTAEVAVFVCTLAFPTLPCPLHVFEPRYRLMLRRCLENGSRQFGMCLPSELDPHGFCDVGVILLVRDVRHMPDGRSVVDCVGGRRFRCSSKSQRDGYHTAVVTYITDQTPTAVDNSPVGGVRRQCALHDHARQLTDGWWRRLQRCAGGGGEFVQRVRSHYGDLPAVEPSYWLLHAGPSWLWWIFAILPVNVNTQLEVLATDSLERRLHMLCGIIKKLEENKRHHTSLPHHHQRA